MNGSLEQPDRPEIGRVAVGIVHTDPPAVYLAQRDDVLSRVLALEVVAKTAPSRIENTTRLTRIRDALLEERWADALADWIDATGTVVDAYPDETVWTESSVGQERASFEIRMAPIFNDETA